MFISLVPVLYSSIWEVFRWLLVLGIKDFLLALGLDPAFRRLQLNPHTHKHYPPTMCPISEQNKKADCCWDSLNFSFGTSVHAVSQATNKMTWLKSFQYPRQEKIRSTQDFVHTVWGSLSGPIMANQSSPVDVREFNHHIILSSYPSSVEKTVREQNGNKLE